MGIAEKMNTYLTTFSQASDSEFKYFITPLFKFCPCDFEAFEKKSTNIISHQRGGGGGSGAGLTPPPPKKNKPKISQ